jgi:hypothetical protein
MSNALAIASVTAVLKDLLDNASIGDSLGNLVTVEVSPPDRIREDEKPNPVLNLFLYNVMPNLGWRNAGLPSHGQQGERLSNPPLALDLYYLLTAYGKMGFQAEILLGYAMQVLHENPVLSRKAIRESLKKTPPDGGILPDKFSALEASDLADQIEQIKVTPHQLSTEEISKLWTAFSAHYRPSVAYHVSVVLIEGKKPAKSPLPVLTRGRPDLMTGREGGVTSQPSLLPQYPTLLEAKPPNQQTAVRMGDELTLTGYRLEGAAVSVRFTHLPSLNKLELSSIKGSTSDQIKVNIPPDLAVPGIPSNNPQHPDNWAAGIYRVAAVISKTGQADKVVTNELSILLAPRLLPVDPPPAQLRLLKLIGNKVMVKCSPKAWENQKIKLVIGDCEIPADAIYKKTDDLSFEYESLKPLSKSKQWLRLRVDGVESILIDRVKTPPAFDDSQLVDIP